MLKKPVVIITGCGSGIGLEIARALYGQKDSLVIATCRAHHIKALRKIFPERIDFKIRELDILNEENIYHLVHSVCSEWGRIDVVINNAAICFRGVVEHMDSEAELLQLKTNYLGPMALIRAVLPIMREQRAGQIINVSSVSGILAMPTMGSYSASKHALQGATEALWYETKPFGITVNLVELGFVNSESIKNVILSNKARLSTLINGPHSEYYNSMTPFIESLMKYSFSSPKKIADRIIKTTKQQPAGLRVFATPDVWIFDLMRRLTPSFLMNQFLFWLLPGSVKWGGLWKKRQISPSEDTLQATDIESYKSV
jgi:NAD(P)-dependent dehydrogenase (short-subunit alcohol dehydrogenase family)